MAKSFPWACLEFNPQPSWCDAAALTNSVSVLQKTKQQTDDSLPLATLFFSSSSSSNPTTGKQFSSCWPVLALPGDIQGPAPELLVAFWSLIFKMDDEAPCPPPCLFFFFLSVFPPLCRDTVRGRLHSCSGRRLSLHKCPSFISQAEGRLYRSGWLVITPAGGWDVT